MTITLYHQAGHNTNWNTESFSEDACGDGIIFSPADYPKHLLEGLSSNILSHSLFDPQYYLPNSQRQKFTTYPFFPESITSGFSTTDFQAKAHESAKQCLEFQIRCNFKYLVVPTRFYDQMFSDYFEAIEQLTVIPFLDELENLGDNRPVYLGIAITKHMLSDDGFRRQLLNWITKFTPLDGVYLIISDERETKQVQDEQRMRDSLSFANEAKDADLDLIIGYCNTEGLLYAPIDDIGLTFGSFENTRRFSIDRYVVGEGTQRGPAPRIYVPGLFNWIRLNEAQEIRNLLPDLWSRVYTSTPYGDQALNAAILPNFNSPLLYKHHFCSFSEQVSNLKNIGPEQRREFLETEIDKAQDEYKKIYQSRITLEEHSSGNHLKMWSRIVKSM